MLVKTALTALAVLFPLGAAWAQALPGPTFSDPTRITNPYAPVEPDTVKVYAGRDEGDSTLTVEKHLEQTRTFDYHGLAVECRIVEERSYIEGALAEISFHYLAQDDAGNVAYFGEVSWTQGDGEDGPPGPEEDSWLVGGATEPTDPPDAFNASEPTVFMIANPRVGDSFQQQVFPNADETLTIVAVGETVRTPAGTYSTAIRVMETNDVDQTPPEYFWAVAGVGAVKESARTSRAAVIATDLVELEPGADGDGVEVEVGRQ